MSDNVNDDVLVDLIAKMASKMRHQMDALIYDLAVEGNLPAVEYLVDHKLADPSANPSVAKTLQMLPVVAPLAFSNGDVRSTTVEQWKSRFGAPELSMLSRRLAECSDLGAAEKLIAAGADPLYATNDDPTPLYHAINMASPEVARLLVRHCVERDRVPFASSEPDSGIYSSVFEYLTRITYSSSKVGLFASIADDLYTGEVGPNCRNELARLLGGDRDPRSDPRILDVSVFKSVLKTALAARLDAQEWMAFAQSFEIPGSFFHALAVRAELGALAVEVIEQMHVAGVKFNEPHACLEKSGPVKAALIPVLHCAARADHAAMVSTLLSLGADPSIKGPVIRGKARDAYEVATKPIAALLAAHDARQAISAKVASTSVRVRP